MKLVLDACSLIAYFNDEEGAEVIKQYLKEKECFIHAVNLCEVYYDFLKEKQSVANFLTDVSKLGIIIRYDLDNLFWMQVGILKEKIRKISFADCFGIALANKLNASLLTADHHELEKVEKMQLCSIEFFR
ncbi:PIN domain-containing protein [bacterium]|nr:PIN domain-containing protein [bacterium]